MRFEVRTDRSLIRADGQSARYVLVDIVAPTAPARAGRLPVNLSLVLDRSGSMKGNKIQMARRAVLRALEVLKPEDHFSVVAYDDRVDVVVPSMAATDQARADAQRALERVHARGTTDLCAGWLRGCEQVATNLASDAVGRALLLSDGLANRGITDYTTLLGHASELRRRGVSTSTFGFGEDYDDRLMRGISEAAGGNFYLVERAEQIPEFIARETGEVIEITARDAVLVVEAGDDVDVQSLNAFPTSRHGNTWHLELGSLVSDQRLSAIVRLAFPPGKPGRAKVASFTIKDRERTPLDPRILRWEYADHAANDAQPRDADVDRIVAEIYSARAEKEAFERNRDGDYVSAKQILKSSAARIRGYAKGDPQMVGIVSRLERQAEKLGVDIGERARKVGTYEANAKMKMRSLKGASRRSPAIALFPGRTDIADLVQHAQARLAGEVSLIFEDAIIERDVLWDATQSGSPLSSSDWLTICQRATQAAPGAKVRVVFTERPFEDNWFSHWDPATASAVVTLSGWRSLTRLSPLAFVAYELVRYGLRASSPEYDPEQLAHQETRGCVFDFCQTKHDVDVKLQTGGLCADCAAALQVWGIFSDHVLRALDVVRDLAVPVGAAGWVREGGQSGRGTP